MTNETFDCNCNGETTVIDKENIYHACNRPSQSYGMEGAELPYHRVLMASGKNYQWFVTWK